MERGGGRARHGKISGASYWGDFCYHLKCGRFIYSRVEVWGLEMLGGTEKYKDNNRATQWIMNVEFSEFWVLTFSVFNFLYTFMPNSKRGEGKRLL